MKKKLKNKLIVFFSAVLSLLIFGGCRMGDTLEDVKDKYNLTAQVTYYSNGGVFESGKSEKVMYYSAGAKALNIGVVTPSSGSVGISYDGYELIGWYHVNEVIDEETGLCELGEEVDFSQALQEDEEWTVAAKWRLIQGLKIVMACEENETIEVGSYVNNNAAVSEGVTSFKNGDVIGEIYYDKTDKLTTSATPDSRLFKVKDSAYTFYAYYLDEACTQEVSFPLPRGEEQLTVYAKYITGNWTFVSTVLDVNQMFSALRYGGEKNYWICGDINCETTTVAPIVEFAGRIKGNGYTLSNLKVTETISAGANFALFGDIQETAKISDLTIENITMSCTFKTGFKADVYFAFLSLAEGAEVTNVTLQGALTVSGAAGYGVNNAAQTDEEGDYTNCLYGGFETDEAYITQTNGNGVTVVMKGTDESGNEVDLDSKEIVIIK